MSSRNERCHNCRGPMPRPFDVGIPVKLCERCSVGYYYWFTATKTELSGRDWRPMVADERGTVLQRGTQSMSRLRDLPGFRGGPAPDNDEDIYRGGPPMNTSRHPSMSRDNRPIEDQMNGLAGELANNVTYAKSHQSTLDSIELLAKGAAYIEELKQELAELDTDALLLKVRKLERLLDEAHRVNKEFRDDRAELKREIARLRAELGIKLPYTNHPTRGTQA